MALVLVLVLVLVWYCNGLPLVLNLLYLVVKHNTERTVFTAESGGNDVPLEPSVAFDYRVYVFCRTASPDQRLELKQ